MDLDFEGRDDGHTVQYTDDFNSVSFFCRSLVDGVNMEI